MKKITETITSRSRAWRSIRSYFCQKLDIESLQVEAGILHVIRPAAGQGFR
jgi:hypothetical protein